jgi:hypothetical protein
MAKIETPYCPECQEAFDYPAPPPVDRRNFLRATAAGAAAVALGGATVQAAAPIPRKPKPAEEIVRELFSTLKDEQKKRVLYAYDHGAQKNNRNAIPTRMGMYNGPIMNVRLADVYTKAQQELVKKAVKSLTSGDDGYYQISREGTWDGSGSFERTGALFFGDPTKKDEKFAFVFAGHHLTIRCDGNTEEGPAFGGPIYYGHTPYGFSADNCFYYQTLAVMELYKALNGKQRELAVVKQRAKGEAKELAPSVRFRGERERPGIPSSELTCDQRELAEKVMKTVLSPYRSDDVDEVMEIVKKNGGMDKIKFAFYPEGKSTAKEPFHFWRLEGPGFVWNYRVLDHVHTYVNISSKLS